MIYLSAHAIELHLRLPSLCASEVDKMKMMVALGSNKEYAVAQRKQRAATGGGD